MKDDYRKRNVCAYFPEVLRFHDDEHALEVRANCLIILY